MRQNFLNTTQKGRYYEEQAAEYLKNLGFKIIRRNFFARYGEIDIIASEGDTTVFVEVKYRRTECMGKPYEAVDFRKRQKIITAARYYAAKEGLYSVPVRFDVVEITGSHITHIRDAFRATEV